MTTIDFTSAALATQADRTAIPWRGRDGRAGVSTRSPSCRHSVTNWSPRGLSDYRLGLSQVGQPAVTDWGPPLVKSHA